MSHPEVMPHGGLSEAFPDIFWVQGSVRMAPGVVINRVMVVLRHEGELTLINAVRLDEEGLAALEALGRVTQVVKIGVHGMDDAFYVERYEARYWAPPGAKTPIPASHELSHEGPQPVPWVRTLAFEHTVDPEVVLLADRAEGVLLTCDCVQDWPDLDRCSLMAKAVTKLMGFTGRRAVIGPPWKKRMTPEGGSLEPDFRRVAELPFEHLIAGHGTPMVGGAREALRATIEATFT